MKKLILILIALAQIPLAHAYVECSAIENQTDETIVNLASAQAPDILFNEVSFKNSTADFIELYIKDDKNSGNGASLKGIFIESSDGSSKKIENDLIAKTGNFILLTFKSTAQDESTQTNNLVKLFSSKDGLVSTTNALVLKSSQNNTLDASCWDDGTPTETQQQKITEITSSADWIGACVDSSAIKTNESTARNLSASDTNQLSDWQKFVHATPGQANEIKNNPPIAKITIQQGEISGSPPLSINVTGEESSDPDNDTLAFSWDFGDGYTYSTANPPSHSYEKAGTYTLTLNVSDSFGAAHSDSLLINVIDSSAPIVPQETTTPQEQPAAAQETANPTPQNPTPQNIKIIINEFMPDPEGTDTNNEWIEIKNLSSTSVNLKDYKLDDIEGGSSPYTFPETILAPDEIKAFYSNITKITLNNDTDKVRIIDPSGNLIDEILYEKTVSGRSFGKNNENQWSLTSNPTPNAENIFSSDEQPSVKCSQVSSANIVSGGITDSAKSSSKTVQKENFQFNDEIMINEIFPNPKSVDTDKEWIELYNYSDEKIDLSGWRIKSANGKKKFTFKDETVIKPGAYLAISSKESKFVLKNKGDKIQLIDPEETVIDELEFGETPENMSYARILTGAEDGTYKASWEWTRDTTKNAQNSVYETFNIKVSEPAEANKFKALKNNKEIAVSYSESILPNALASSVIKPGAEFSIKAVKTDKNSYELKQLEEKFAQEINENNETNAHAKIEESPKYKIYLAIVLGISLISTIAAVIYIKKTIGKINP